MKHTMLSFLQFHKESKIILFVIGSFNNGDSILNFEHILLSRVIKILSLFLERNSPFY